MHLDIFGEMYIDCVASQTDSPMYDYSATVGLGKRLMYEVLPSKERGRFRGSSQKLRINKCKIYEKEITNKKGKGKSILFDYEQLYLRTNRIISF